MTGLVLIGLAAGSAFGSVWLACPVGSVVYRLTPRYGAWRTAAVRRRGTAVLAAMSAFTLVFVLRSQGLPVVVLAVGAIGVALAVQRLVASWRRRETMSRRRADVIELCDALAAELEAGLPAPTAVNRACAAWPEFAAVANAARLGDDVGAALRRSAARMPGAEGLRSVAAAWDVAARSGAGLALVLSRVAAGLRSDEEARAEVTAALGPPRATAKMLAVLPVFGIGLGVSMGADPLGFLLGSGAGVVCLGIGTGLALAGLWWVERLASAVEI